MARKANKFTESSTPKQTKDAKRKGEIITKGSKKFIKCPKCGWIHTIDTEKCRFCGAEL